MMNSVQISTLRSTNNMATYLVIVFIEIIGSTIWAIVWAAVCPYTGQAQTSSISVWNLTENASWLNISIHKGLWNVCNIWAKDLGHKNCL